MELLPEILQFPFMQRAFIAGVATAVILAWIGVFVVSRRMSFVGDGIAHASLAGVAIALLLGVAPIPLTLVFGVLLAIGLFFLERKLKISSDAAIGIVFAFGMALGVFLLQFREGFQPELISFLFGNILSISTLDVAVILAISLVIVILLFIFGRKLAFVTFDEEGAYLSGLVPSRYILFLYIMTAISIVLSIRVAGIVLVSALLILPVATARLFAKSFSGLRNVAIIYGVVMMVAGLVASFYLDTPSGATIVLIGGVLFFLGVATSSIFTLKR